MCITACGSVDDLGEPPVLHLFAYRFFKKIKSDKMKGQIGQQAVVLKETTLNIHCYYKINDYRYIYECMSI